MSIEKKKMPWYFARSMQTLKLPHGFSNEPELEQTYLKYISQDRGRNAKCVYHLFQQFCLGMEGKLIKSE